MLLIESRGTCLPGPGEHGRPATNRVRSVVVMDLWANFWDVIWWFVWAFAFVSYLVVLFHVIADIFRDEELGGWAKALWMVCLVFLPFLTALVYLVARGRGMAERSARASSTAQESAEAYIRQVAGSSPSDEIAKAKSLLDAGTITTDEFATLKTRALSGPSVTGDGAGIRRPAHA